MTVIINGTTGITNVNGTASAPAATGTDTDSGIVYGTNTVSLATNGTTALTVDASQNVGIGTASPAAKLDIASGNVLLSNNQYFGVKDTTGAAVGFPIYTGSNDAIFGYLASGSTGISTYQFRTGNNTERMRIDSAGRFTLSYQPFFYAYLNVAQTGYNPQSTGDAPVIYNATTTNTGSHYNTSTGKFTAPVAGNYIFYASAYSVGTTFSQNWLVVNGSRIIGTDWVHSSSNMSTGFWLIKLAANDTVGFHAYNGAVSSATIATNPEHTYFKGYLLS